MHTHTHLKFFKHAGISNTIFHNNISMWGYHYIENSCQSMHRSHRNSISATFSAHHAKLCQYHMTKAILITFYPHAQDSNRLSHCTAYHNETSQPCQPCLRSSLSKLLVCGTVSRSSCDSKNQPRTSGDSSVWSGGKVTGLMATDRYTDNILLSQLCSAGIYR